MICLVLRGSQKSRPHCAILLLLAILAQGCGARSLPPRDTLGEWRSAGGNPERTGSLDPDLSFPLEEAWRVNAGRGMHGSPVPAGALVIVATTDGRIRAYLAEDGEKLWEKKIKGGFFSSPVVSDRKLFIASEFPDGSLYCLEIRKGETVWKRATGPCRSTCTIDGGVIYTINNAGEVLAHMTTSGDLLWKSAVRSLRPQSPAVVRDSLYVLSEGDSIKIVSSADGSLLESRFLPLPPYANSAFLKDHFLYGSGKGLGAVPTSVPATELDLSGVPETYRVAVAGDVILGIDGRRRAFAYDTSEGEIKWTVSTSGLLEARPTVAGDRVIVVSLSGEIKVIDIDSGTVVWEDNIGASIPSPPLVSGNRLFLATERGDLIAYAPGNGAESKGNREKQ